MGYDILDKINSISDLKELSHDDVERLCAQIREFLIDKVSISGGHLASNLGAVELSVALHRVFDSPSDHIIFDVGHQSYVHKILTGRKDDFDNLRRPGGLSGFTSMRESEHDAFGAGHSSTSISAALGYAESDRLLGKDNYTVAVVGDGAFTGGMIHEAINNCKPELKLIILLNENGMSISSNKGAFASYLADIRTSKGYITVKKSAHSILNRLPIVGKAVASAISYAKSLVKRVVYRTNYFEDLGFYYLGVIDGNDHRKVERALKKAKDLGKCVVVHVKTTKGKGFAEAESSPEKFHSVANDGAGASTYHSVFANELIDLAREHKDVVAVTAAMGIGTGLSDFEKSYPDRYFDVGIAESHALTFSAGLAASGLKPFTAIYSTFLQRAYDNIVHDVALQNLPVKMFIDRAGLAVSDGATHHGIFDVSFLSHIPEVEIFAPVGYESLKECVRYAYSAESAVAVRYPNSRENLELNAHFTHCDRERGIKLDFDPTNPPKNIYVTYGAIAKNVIEAKQILKTQGINAVIVLIENIKPYKPTVEFLKGIISSDTHLVYVEEGIKNGGAAMITRDLILGDANIRCASFDIAAIDDSFAVPSELCELYDYVGLSPEKLAKYFLIRGNNDI